MKKFLKLKEWVSVAEAAQRLAMVSGEEVTEADLLQYVLDGYLTISVYFVTEVMGQRCVVLPALDKAESEIITEKVKSMINAPSKKNEPFEAVQFTTDLMRVQLTIDKTHCILSPTDRENPTLIKGVWDLAMIGGETDYVKNQFMARIGKREITPSLDDLLITNQERDEFYSLLRREHVKNIGLCHVSAARMPDDILLVVRTTELLRFQEQLLADDRQSEKSTGKNQQDAEPKASHLLAIAALLELLAEPISQARAKRNQSAIKNAIMEKNKNRRGLSTRNLDDIFADANKAMAEAKKTD